MKYIITSKEIFREGIKNGRKWVLYKVQDSKGGRHSTFQDLPLDQEVELEQEIKEVTKDGKTYKNSTLSLPKRGGQAAQADPKVGKQLERMEAKLDEIYDFLLSSKESKVVEQDPEPAEKVPF